MKDYEVKQKRIFYSFLALNLMLTVSKRRILYTRLFSPIDFIIDSQYSYPRNFRSLSHPHSFHWHSTRSALVYERSINGKFNFIQTRDSYFSNSSRSIKIVYASVHSISCRYCNLYRLFGWYVICWTNGMVYTPRMKQISFCLSSSLFSFVFVRIFLCIYWQSLWLVGWFHERKNEFLILVGCSRVFDLGRPLFFQYRLVFVCLMFCRSICRRRLRIKIKVSTMMTLKD